MDSHEVEVRRRRTSESEAIEQFRADLDLLADVVLGLAELSRAATAQANGWLGAEVEDLLQRIGERRKSAWRPTRRTSAEARSPRQTT